MPQHAMECESCQFPTTFVVHPVPLLPPPILGITRGKVNGACHQEPFRKSISRWLRPTPPPRLGLFVLLARVSANLLCCERTCRLLLVNLVSRTSPWSVLCSIGVFEKPGEAPGLGGVLGPGAGWCLEGERGGRDVAGSWVRPVLEARWRISKPNVSIHNNVLSTSSKWVSRTQFLMAFRFRCSSA